LIFLKSAIVFSSSKFKRISTTSVCKHPSSIDSDPAGVGGGTTAAGCPPGIALGRLPSSLPGVALIAQFFDATFRPVTGCLSVILLPQHLHVKASPESDRITDLTPDSHDFSVTHPNP
jgi:hypothetical protein